MNTKTLNERFNLALRAENREGMLAVIERMAGFSESASIALQDKFIASGLSIAV